MMTMMIRVMFIKTIVMMTMTMSVRYMFADDEGDVHANHPEIPIQFKPFTIHIVNLVDWTGGNIIL